MKFYIFRKKLDFMKYCFIIRNCKEDFKWKQV